MPPIKQPPSVGTPKSTDEAIKDTFESIVIAFILAFVFRAYVVEAFVIPTGSMAPTLLGQHVRVRCPECGYEHTFDQTGPTTRRDILAPCPMCWYPIEVPFGSTTRSGDRLLVQKYIYNVSEPNRWDVVVFRNPQRMNFGDRSAGPKTNYIKRLVGLPGEALHIIDGNIYVRPIDADDSTWHIARKTDPEANSHWKKIQRAVWQPIYHSRFIPLDQGTDGPEIDPQDPVRGRAYRWACPWKPRDNDPRWNVGSADTGWRSSYRLDLGNDNTNPAELSFNWRGYHDTGTHYPYNRVALINGTAQGQPIEDIRLAASIVPDTADLTVEFQTTARLYDQVDTLIARVTPDGKLSLIHRNGVGDRPLAETTVTPMPAGRPTRLELWFVDQEAIVLIDDREALRLPFDLPMRQLMSRPGPDLHPEVAIRLSGSSATLHAVQLDRDLYYTAYNHNDEPAVGALRRLGDTLLEAPPVLIHPDEFFVLGDNSPISNDARFWNTVEPWIEKRMFPPASSGAEGGSNGLSESGYDINTPAGSAPPHTHVVPRGLMIGRAFFIYYPAPYAAIRGGQRQVLPNFGDMRLVN